MRKNKKINCGRTAIRRRKLSKPLRILLERGFIHQDTHSIFDFGHGRGDDMCKLRLAGFDVAGWDQNYHITAYSVDDLDKVDKGLYNWVHCGYVLNVIPRKSERKAVIRTIRGLISKGHHASFAVRTQQDIIKSRRDTWQQYKDGYVTPIKTFQKGYEPAELIKLLLKLEWRAIHMVSREPLLIVATK